MKKQKLQDSYKTPNEKFNAEFAEENSSQTSSKAAKGNFKTPNEKFNAEFEQKK
ncbi:hypothetical protein MUG84_16640 [Paenibacillus sp. KQZ6P-2]|uniref:Uncharacterized protein n=1 Tax=Paenibacillus mangrovi TaxID=2931978 RepID=A0A9X1WQS4_9BACL|nr:hypothetical protein [Paenibacillus mangrovi]MCJ8013359.1 hypothetical protein [Paenibacillus mangrovi]